MQIACSSFACGDAYILLSWVIPILVHTSRIAFSPPSGRLMVDRSWVPEGCYLLSKENHR